MKQILLVDDEDDFVETVCFFLEQNNFKVVTASNGKQAIEKLDAGIPDLILLDIMMPEMDGLQTCRQLKSCESFANIPIIMLTAKGQSGDVKEAIVSGANDYIVKPFDFDDLILRIKKVLNLGFGYNTISK